MFRTTTRPIHKLILVVPVEEQISAVGQAREDDASKGQAANPAGPAPVCAEGARTAEAASPGREPEAARQEGVEAAGEGGSLTEARPHPSQSREGVAGPTIEPREAISRRKAGEKAQAIVGQCRKKRQK